MKTFVNKMAQGDTYFRRVESLPTDVTLTQVLPENGRLVVTHSETGHHHSVAVAEEDVDMVKLFNTSNPLKAFFQTLKPVVLKHERSFDTHEEVLFSPGIYRVSRQREWVPEGFRRVQD